MPEPRMPHREPVRRLSPSKDKGPLHIDQPDNVPGAVLPPDIRHDPLPAEQPQPQPEIGEIPYEDDTTEVDLPLHDEDSVTVIREKDRLPGETREEYIDRKRHEPRGGSEEIPDSNVDFRI